MVSAIIEIIAWYGRRDSDQCFVTHRPATPWPFRRVSAVPLPPLIGGGEACHARREWPPLFHSAALWDCLGRQFRCLHGREVPWLASNLLAVQSISASRL